MTIIKRRRQTWNCISDSSRKFTNRKLSLIPLLWLMNLQFIKRYRMIIYYRTRISHSLVKNRKIKHKIPLRNTCSQVSNFFLVMLRRDWFIKDKFQSSVFIEGIVLMFFGSRYCNDLENAFTLSNFVNIMLSSVNICCVVFTIVVRTASKFNKNYKGASAFTNLEYSNSCNFSAPRTANGGE